VSAREAILGAIRTQLAGAAAPGAPVGAPAGPPRAGLETAAGRLGAFHERLEAVGGRVHVVPDERAARAALAAIVRELGAREVALSDSELVRRVAEGLEGPEGIRLFDGSRDRARLLACDLGISGAQWGIAETGTLVLDSARERHRLVSVVPPVHVALLEARTILPALEDALEAARVGHGRAAPPSTLTFITGPSRTADIELTLVVGVHGPRALHAIVIA